MPMKPAPKSTNFWDTVVPPPLLPSGWPWCHRCAKPVKSVETWDSFDLRTFNIQVKCHGDFRILRISWALSLRVACAIEAITWRKAFEDETCVALQRLVMIGKMRNGRELFMPAAEFCLILDEIVRAEESFDDFCATLVADHQRVYDAILTGETRPFEARALPTLATFLRHS
jgi:hypothetical protein